MKKNFLFLRKDGQISKWMITYCLCLFLVGVTSCKQGFDNNEVFYGGVTGVTLESPDPGAVTFTKLDGTKVKIVWPVVMGAGGYTFSFYIVNDPDNPILVGEENEFIDGCSAIREYLDETKYKAVIKTLGNVQLNNKEAVDVSNKNWDTYLPAKLIPDGTDLYTYFTQNPIATENGEEVGYELVTGGSYTMSSKVDFDLNTVTLRGDKVNHPTVVLGTDGGIVTQAGLTVKFIDFDCSAASAVGIVSLSTTPDASIKKGDYYLIHNSIAMQECNFKRVNHGIFYGNGKDYAVKNYRISDCIVQMNSSGGNSIINVHGGKGAIKDLTVMNSTFYNLKANSSGYFVRYSSASNANPGKLGFDDTTGSVSIINNTFCKVMTGRDFGNGLASHNVVTPTLKNNVFYDVYRINKIIGGSNKKEVGNNFMFSVTNPLDNTDKTYGTEEDPSFVGPIDADPDTVNFKPASDIASAQAGDPRWY